MPPLPRRLKEVHSIRNPIFFAALECIDPQLLGKILVMIYSICNSVPWFKTNKAGSLPFGPNTQPSKVTVFHGKPMSGFFAPHADLGWGIGVKNQCVFLKQGVLEIDFPLI